MLPAGNESVFVVFEVDAGTGEEEEGRGWRGRPRDYLTGGVGLECS